MWAGTSEDDIFSDNLNHIPLIKETATMPKSIFGVRSGNGDQGMAIREWSGNDDQGMTIRQRWPIFEMCNKDLGRSTIPQV
jgi:hypothetical protein